MPPTIGLVAERMSVDPSRASRIVAELVTRGYVERQAAQDDARKSVLVMTPKAYEFLQEFSAAKWRILARVFEGWKSSEIDAFATLFHRYVDGIEPELRGES
ncbi:MAG: MarR family transcriptional regulator [Maritimibacter sp.]